MPRVLATEILKGTFAPGSIARVDFRSEEFTFECVVK